MAMRRKINVMVNGLPGNMVSEVFKKILDFPDEQVAGGENGKVYAMIDVLRR